MTLSSPGHAKELGLSPGFKVMNVRRRRSNTDQVVAASVSLSVSRSTLIGGSRSPTTAGTINGTRIAAASKTAA
jgi:hypothetical protein